MMYADIHCIVYPELQVKSSPLSTEERILVKRNARDVLMKSYLHSYKTVERSKKILEDPSFLDSVRVLVPLDAADIVG